jgi:hypothetical protein
MLSAETAAGAYPRLAVEAMTRIIKEIETHPPVAPLGAEQGDGVVTTEVAIAAATVAAVECWAPLWLWSSPRAASRLGSWRQNDLPSRSSRSPTKGGHTGS